MNLIFKVDKKYDEEMILEFIPKDALNNTQMLADFFRMDSDEIESILKDKKLPLKKTINILNNNKYRTLSLFFKNSVSDYQKSWDKINDDLSKLVAIKTNCPWKYKKYYCVISAYHGGISSWGGNIIVRCWSYNADVQRKVTAHELVLSHFWTMLEKNNTSKKWPKNKKWQYSEIFSWCLLGLDPDFSKFWPWLLKKDRFPTNHQYADIISLQKRLRGLYLKSKNFSDFFEKAIKISQ